ncbi:MAG: hypothetical protein Q8869_03225, partial [Candidatus Phytoplasma australasiaticum]|nr:hypothetical protein [Candidatus Phytoplasma australasiaticum]
ATLVGGILFIGVELALKNRPVRDAVSWPVAIAVGLGQLVAAVLNTGINIIIHQNNMIIYYVY